MSIKQLIEAIEQGDASTISALFDKLMAEKLAEAIEEKKEELAESLFEEEDTYSVYDFSEGLTEAYTASGKVTHAGQVHSFKVKYDDFPDHKDVEKQNPHLSKHHVEAVMRHFESHGDDDMTGTHSTHQGAKVHMTHNGGSMDESLDEAAGAMAGLPKNITKHLTRKTYGGGVGGAGENSAVTKHTATSASSLSGHVKAGLDAGHAVAVHVNGKLHKVVTSNGDGGQGQRGHFQVHDAAGQNSQKETKWVRTRVGASRYENRKHERTEVNFTKSDALHKTTGGMGDGSSEKKFFKDNHVEVHHIARDEERAKKATARAAAKPEMQANFVKAKEGEKKEYYHSDKKQTSTTSAGDNLKGIKDAAAERLAKKKLGASGESAKSKALEIHKNLAKHIEAGDHRAVRQSLRDLEHHVSNVGLQGHEEKVKEYAKHLKDMKGWRREYAKKDMAKLRGETNESVDFDDLDEAFDRILAMYEQIDELNSIPMEDIEAFMQTEDFEALDELSKTTLGNYVKKAATSMAVTHAKKVQKDTEADEVDRFTNRHMNNKFGDQEKIKDMIGASQSERYDLHRKTMKRMSGIGKAADKLSK